MCKITEKAFNACGFCAKLKWIFAQHLRTAHAPDRARLKVVVTDRYRGSNTVKKHPTTRPRKGRSQSECPSGSSTPNTLLSNMNRETNIAWPSICRSVRTWKVIPPKKIKKASVGKVKKVKILKQSDCERPLCLDLGVGDSGKAEYKCTACDFVTCYKPNVKRHYNSVHFKTAREKKTAQNLNKCDNKPEMKTFGDDECDVKDDVLPSDPSVSMSNVVGSNCEDMIGYTSRDGAQVVYDDVSIYRAIKTESDEPGSEDEMSTTGRIVSSAEESAEPIETQNTTPLPEEMASITESSPSLNKIGSMKSRKLLKAGKKVKTDSEVSYETTEPDESGKVNYKCKECDYTQDNKFYVSRHYSVVHAQSRVSCEGCHKTFVNKVRLEFHQQNNCYARKQSPYATIIEENGTRKFQCSACSYVTTTFGYVRRHYDIMHVDKQNKIPGARLNKFSKMTCNVCGMEFEERRSLYFHLLTHTSDKNSTVRDDEKAPVTDMEWQIGGNKRPACAICNKTFATFLLLLDHMNVHNGKTPHLCDICGKAFAQKTTLYCHKRIHEDKRPFKCDLCPKAFRYASKLEDHKNSHAGIKPYSCEYCGKGFTDKTNLNVHIRIHTGYKPYKCDLCDYRSSSSSSIKIHKTCMHTTERLLKCKTCNSSFKLMSKLRAHEKRHWHEKPHKCSYCGKSFVDKNSLRDHETVHTNIRRYGCAVCKMMFKRIDTTKQHIKSQHPSVPHESRRSHVFDATKVRDPPNIGTEPR